MPVTDDLSPAVRPQRLRRVLTFWDLIFYGIVIIQPTAPLPSFGIVNTVSRGHAVSAILIAMLAMMLTAVSYGRMARAYPNAGSAYTFVGRELHPNLGLLTGWSIALDYILNPTIAIIWCSKAAMNMVPLPFYVWVVFFVVVFAWVNLLGVKMNARTNTFLTIGMFSVLVCFFVAAVGYLLRMAGVAGLFSTLPFYNPPEFEWASVKQATSIAVLTYMGFDSISTLSEDVKDPEKNILRATVSLCLITGILGGLEVYLGQRIWPDFHNYPDIDTAFVSVAGRVAGPWMYYLMNATLLVATIGSGIGGQLGASRLLYAMGRDDVIPRGFFARLDPIRNTPQNNIFLISALALFGALLMTYEAGAELLNYGAFIAFMGVNLANARHTLKSRSLTRKLNWTVNLFIPFAGFFVCLYIWWSLRNAARIAGTVWLVIGVIYCAVRTGGFRRRLELSDAVEEE